VKARAIIDPTSIVSSSASLDDCTKRIDPPTASTAPSASILLRHRLQTIASTPPPSRRTQVQQHSVASSPPLPALTTAPSATILLRYRLQTIASTPPPSRRMQVQQHSVTSSPPPRALTTAPSASILLRHRLQTIEAILASSSLHRPQRPFEEQQQQK
jgi:hypothetical protein